MFIITLIIEIPSDKRIVRKPLNVNGSTNIKLN